MVKQIGIYRSPMRERVGTWGPTLREPSYPTTSRENDLTINQMVERVLAYSLREMREFEGTFSKSPLKKGLHLTDKSKFDIKSRGGYYDID